MEFAAQAELLFPVIIAAIHMLTHRPISSSILSAEIVGAQLVAAGWIPKQKQVLCLSFSVSVWKEEQKIQCRLFRQQLKMSPERCEKNKLV